MFPEGTDVKVKREGTRLRAPGIGDDTRGLAVMLALIRALNRRRSARASDILFVGNVGEEGEGDLRGMKFLLQKGQVQGPDQAVPGDRRQRRRTASRDGGVGSKRYRVTFKGPGGHSYGAFGLVNPAFAMGGAIAQVLATLEVPAVAQDDVQRRRRPRRHVGELDPVRGQHGRRHAIRVAAPS